MVQAQALDRIPPDQRGPLHGIPVAIKDVTETADMPTTYGSRAYPATRPDLMPRSSACSAPPAP